MAFPILRQSTLDRNRSIMGLWILTLTLTLGIVIGEQSCRMESTPARHSRGGLDRSVSSIASRLSKSVFSLKSPMHWIETKSDWSRATSPTKRNDLGLQRPFERPNEPDFCLIDAQRLPTGLSIKLAGRHERSRRKELHLNLFAQYFLEADFAADAGRKEPSYYGAFISGAPRSR